MDRTVGRDLPHPVVNDSSGPADSLVELSKDEMRSRLQEASEVKQLISVRLSPSSQSH